MTVDHRVLHEIGAQPRARWRQLLEAEFDGDRTLVRQGMMWLSADQASREAAPPSLGTARYELLVELDRGATATVWQARDRLLERAVAVKVFHDHAATEEVMREARAASDIVSDHIVRILDVQQHEADQSYLVVELVGEYETSGDLVLGTAASDCRPRSIDEAVRWSMQIARGVHDAHLRNVFHRDLNPRNVLITPLSRRARIADFGLAASNQGAGPSFRGTPAYMAPEQARGLVVDSRAALIAVDVWGLGAIAYDLITGRAPWAGDAAWERAVCGAVDRVPNRIPRALSRIVEKMLAPEPEARYRSAAEVADELAAFLASRPTSFDRSRMQRARLWSRRNPQVTLTGIVALALMVLVLGSLVALAQLRDQQGTLLAELAVQQAEHDRVAAGVTRTRAVLIETEHALEDRTGELTRLEQSVAEQRKANVEVLSAKERALQQAAATTHLLLGKLEDLQDDRNLAESTRKLYERFWASARLDADRVTNERLRIEGERDAARAEVTTLRDRVADLQRELDALRGPQTAGSEPAVPQLE